MAICLSVLYIVALKSDLFFAHVILVESEKEQSSNTFFNPNHPIICLPFVCPRLIGGGGGVVVNIRKQTLSQCTRS